MGTQRLQFLTSTRTDAVFSQQAKGGVLLLAKGFDFFGVGTGESNLLQEPHLLGYCLVQMQKVS